MRSTVLLALTFTTAALAGLGTAAAAPATSDVCLAGCTSSGLSADDQATCRLQCARLAQTPAQPATQPTVTAPPAQSQPTPPVAAPPPAPQFDPHQHALCESQCDAEPVASDRATCRLQCAQLARTRAPSAPSTSSSGPITGPITTYSFAPGGGQLPATTPTSGYPTSSYPTTSPPNYYSQQHQQIASCQATCDREASATDRQTCRNNCGAVGTVLGPAAPGQWVLGPAPIQSDADQRAAIIRSSGGVVSGGPPPASSPRPATSTTSTHVTTTVTPLPTAQATPPAQPANAAQCAAQAQACSNACTADQQPCTATCDQGRMSSTDRATCKLTCESNGDMCRDDCRIKEAACRGPTYR